MIDYSAEQKREGARETCMMVSGVLIDYGAEEIKGAVNPITQTSGIAD